MKSKTPPKRRTHRRSGDGDGAWSWKSGRLPARPTAAWLLVLMAGLSPPFGCADEIRVSLLEPRREPATATERTEPGLDARPPTNDLSTAPTEVAPAPAPDTAADAAPEPEEEPTTTLVHHYDFAGEGVVVVDRVGDADGTLVGGVTLDGKGGVVLDGVDDYVDLPNGLLSVLEVVTLTAWIEWFGGECWQRIFDFGSSSGGEDTSTGAETSLFATPSSCSETHAGPVTPFAVLAMFHVRGSAYTAYADTELPKNEKTLVALTVSVEQGLSLFVNGQLVAQTPVGLRVSSLDDQNVWLGRSQWGHDANFSGRYEDFRIYDGALSLDQLAALQLELSAQR